MAPVRYKKAFNTIVLDFPKTIKPDTTREKILIPFFHQNLMLYMKDNWANSADLVDIVRQLRIQSETTRAKNPDCPSIAPTASPPDLIIKTVNDYVKWAYSNNMENRGIERLRSLLWSAGYKRGMIKSDIYPDVPEAFAYWSTFNLKIFTYASVPIHEQKLILNVDKQRKLSEYVKFFMEKEKIGDKDDTASYVKITTFSRTESTNVLFITDYEPYAKAAIESGIHVVILQRAPKKKQQSNVGEYVYINKLTDIVFDSA